MSEIITLKRVFKYNNLVLDDPGDGMTPDEVKNFYAGIYPELAQSIIKDPVTKDGTITYEFVKEVGTKG